MFASDVIYSGKPTNHMETLGQKIWPLSQEALAAVNTPSSWVGVERGPRFQVLAKDLFNEGKRSKEQVSLNTRAREP